jgi:hypothetical protein
MTGALFREEAVVALAALPVARALSVPAGDRIRDLVRTGLWATLGAAAVFAASVPMNLLIYGATLPMHVTQDAWEVAKNTPYLQVRREILVDLFLPISHVPLFVTAAAAGLAASLAEWRRRRAGRPTSDALLVIVHASALVLLFIVVALPLWRLATGVRPYFAYLVTSAAHTWPFALAVLYWPWTGDEASRPAVRYLLVSAVLLLLGTAIVVPTSGGSQWSPRFFMAGAPLIALVAAAAAHHRDPIRCSRGVIVMARAILLASIVMQASGIAWLVRAKAHNARVVHWVASRTADGEVLISDVFWFPEVAATLAPTRRMLFSWSAGDVPDMAAMAIARGLPRFGLVTSAPITGYKPPPTLDVPGAPCRYVRGEPTHLDQLGLLLHRYACEEP